MIDRIKELLTNMQLSPSQFADEIKLQRSSLSHVLSGRNKPSLDFVMKVKERFNDINLDWLIFGKGDIFSVKEEEVIKSFSMANPEQSEMDNQQIMDFDVDTDKNVSEENQISLPKSGSNLKDIKAKVTSSKADRVIIFYNNGTFEEYLKG